MNKTVAPKRKKHDSEVAGAAAERKAIVAFIKRAQKDVYHTSDGSPYRKELKDFLGTLAQMIKTGKHHLVVKELVNKGGE